MSRRVSLGLVIGRGAVPGRRVQNMRGVAKGASSGLGVPPVLGRMLVLSAVAAAPDLRAVSAIVDLIDIEVAGAEALVTQDLGARVLEISFVLCGHKC